MDNQLPPCNIELEESVLGCLLVHPKLVNTVKNWLPVDAFFSTQNRSLYSAMRKLNFDGITFDLMYISSWLADRDRLDEVGGMEKLSRLLACTVSPTNLDRYGLVILEKYKRRKLIVMAHKILEVTEDKTMELNDTYRQIRSLLPHEITQDTQTVDEPLVTKVKYSISSESKRSNFELEAEIDKHQDLAESMRKLALRAEAIAQDLWQLKP